MPENYTKPPLSFEQQIDQLIGRGLEVSDKARAQKFLSSINYYRLSAYWYPFRIKAADGTISSEIKPDTNFDDVLALYEFDRHLRLLLIDAIERIEIAIRTRLSYVLSHEYGAFAHTDGNNFHPKFRHAEWLQKVESETERSSEEFISHYQEKYNGFPTLPIWMVTEVMTLGALSTAYKGMKNDDKKKISSQFGLHHKQLADWLHVLTYVRNICTHHGRLWNRELAIKSAPPKARLWQPPFTPTNKRLFFVLLVIRALLKPLDMGDNWEQEVTALIKPVANNKLWQNAMGLPDNWETHPLWDQ